MELMTDIILEVKRTGLYHAKEIKVLTKKLTQLQYGVNKGTKLLTDFKKLIRCQMQLLAESKRRKSLKKSVQIGKLKVLLLKKIQYCYDNALTYFADDLKFNFEYLDFLKSNSCLNNVAAIHVNRMVERFQSEPTVFQKAASWYMTNSSRQEAIKVLLRGIAAHPRDEHLYLDLVQIELENSEEISSAKFEKIVDSITANVTEPELLIYILNIIPRHSHLVGLIEYIMNNLVQKYPDEEKVWHSIAVMEVNGLYYKKQPIDELNRSVLYCIQKCIKRYEEGIASLPHKKKATLWTFYLDTLVELQKLDVSLTDAIKDDFLNALKKAKSSNVKLRPVHWKAWVDLCGDDEKLILEVMYNSTLSLPDSVELWMMYLKFCLLMQQFERAEEVFDRAIKALGHKAVPIWDMYITTMQLHAENKVDSLLKRASLQPYIEVARIFRAKYLSWCALKIGMSHTRVLYEKLTKIPPATKELHQEMLKLERMEIKEKYDLQSKIYKLYAEEFGREDVDIWIEWIKSVQIHNLKSSDVNEQVTEVYNLAMATLPNDVFNVFRQKFLELRMDRLK